MKVIFLGKARYRQRRSVADFLELGPERGHAVDLWDRDQLLALEPGAAQVDIVLAKSHYWDPQVDRWLRAFGGQVINPPAANQVCRSRRSLNACLARAGVPVPESVEPGQRLRPGERYIIKPDVAADHGLQIVDPGDDRPPTLAGSDGDYFVQSFLESEETIKVYVVGELRFAQSLRYQQVDGRVDLAGPPDRSDRGPLSDAVDRIVTDVIRATGLSVLNLDLVAGARGWLVVDVNPFPSFERVRGGPAALWDPIENPGLR